MIKVNVVVSFEQTPDLISILVNMWSELNVCDIN